MGNDFTVILSNKEMGSIELKDAELPLNLNSFEITLNRHKKYHGVFPEISTTLEFVGTGYLFIKTAYENNGIDAHIVCEIFMDGVSIYTGIVDIKDAVFSAGKVSVRLNSNSPVSLFLSRATTKINLFDEPCFKELTVDKTAVRRRYVYAPYLVTYPEKTVLGWAKGVLDTGACRYGNDVATASDFYIGLGSTGKTIFICDGLGVPCSNYNPACDNYNVHPTSANNEPQPSIGAVKQEAFLRNYPPIKWINNDDNFGNSFAQCDVEGRKLDFVNAFPPPAQLPFEYGQGFTGWVQEFRREEYNIVPPSIRFQLAECGNYVRQFRNYESDADEAGVKDIYKNEPMERLFSAQCDCQEVRVRIRAKGRFKTYFFGSEGVNPSSFPLPKVEFIRANVRARLFLIRKVDLVTPPNAWADITQTLAQVTLGSATWVAPNCQSVTMDKKHYFANANSNCGILAGTAEFLFGGTTAWSSFDTGYLTYNFTGCDLKRGDCVFFAIETQLAGIVDNGSLIIRSVVAFDEIEADILFEKCDRIGETSHYSFAIHESLSRIVEAYTNNRLMVRSAFYGRSNSLEGASDYNFQVEPGCPPINCPNPAEVVLDEEYLKSFQTGAHPNAVCPVDGCGAFKVITTGGLLRSVTKSLYVSFEELFDSLAAIDNIGVGYLDSEPDALRVESYDFFYQDNVLFEIEIDYIKSKFKRKIMSDNYYKKVICGYTDDYIKGYVSSIDEFNTPREYNLSIKNADNELLRRCNFIASGYTIEYCRRSAYTEATGYEEKIFIVCVLPSVNQMNKVETGIHFPFPCATNIPFFRQPNGIISPDTVYNWRIRPFYNAIRQLPLILPSLHFTQDKTLKFAYGELNYTVAGAEPGAYRGCEIGWDSSLNVKVSECENSDINAIKYPYSPKIINEEVEFEYFLTPKQFFVLKNFPYHKISVNGELFYVKNINYTPKKASKIKLIKAF